MQKQGPGRRPQFREPMKRIEVWLPQHILSWLSKGARRLSPSEVVRNRLMDLYERERRERARKAGA